MTASNKDVVLRLSKAFTQQDRETIIALLAGDCVWRVPGRGALSGDYQGRESIMGFFGALRRRVDGPVRFEVIDVAASENRVVLYQHGIVEIGGKQVTFRECLVFTVRDGQVIEMDEFQADLYSFDALFG